ncbi:hypothetical protein L615_001200000850 [Nocardioides sp. J9]|nr:hypothetical protein L615_001200000850 [Nocardioides sp. J9]
MVVLQRVLLAVLWLLAGAAVGTCAVLLHRYPWGLLLGLATTAAVLVAAVPGWWGRPAFAAGWLVVLAVASAERAEGDYLIAADGRGYTLLLSGTVVLAGGVAGFFRRPRQVHDSGGAETAP